MHLNLSADELLTTTLSVRKRLDFDRPVDRAVIESASRLPCRRRPANRQSVALVRRRRRGQAQGDRRHLQGQLRRLPHAAAAEVRGRRHPRSASSVSPTRRSTSPTTCIGRRCWSSRACGDASRNLRRRWWRALGVRCCRRSGASCWRCASADSVRRGPRSTSSGRRTARRRAARHPVREGDPGRPVPVAHKGDRLPSAKRQPLADVLHWDA